MKLRHIVFISSLIFIGTFVGWNTLSLASQTDNSHMVNSSKQNCDVVPADKDAVPDHDVPPDKDAAPDKNVAPDSNAVPDPENQCQD